jgi:FkbM family methyltransferase
MFPTNDKNWVEVAEFIIANQHSSDRIAAPSEFKDVLDNSIDYLFVNTSTDFQWFVLHKGLLNKINNSLIYRVINELKPVHANPVFITFSTHKGLSAIPENNIHLESLFEEVNSQENMFKKLGDINKTNDILIQLGLISKSLKSQANIFLDIREIGRSRRDEIESSCRNACQTSFLGDNSLLCRVLTKYFCYVDATDITLTPHLLLNGYWEIWVTKLLSKTIKTGWNCIDVGANCGYYTLLMADLVGSSGEVIAVEPNPKLASLVNKSIRVNGFSSYTKVCNQAVSAEAGEFIQLCVRDGFLGDATIESVTSLSSSSEDDSFQYFPTVTTTIDELAAEWAHVDLIKIDAEGAEWLIWQGMQVTLSRNPTLMIILEFSNNRPNAYNSKQFLTEIVKCGFGLNYIDGDSNIKSITFDECLTNKDNFIDLLLIR